MEALTSSNLEWKDYMRQNQVVRTWTTRVKGMLKQSAGQFVHGKEGSATREGSRTEHKLRPSLHGTVTYSHGISDGSSFKIQRHGVFVHKGVGRGYKMQSGMVVRTAKSANPDPRPRVPIDWFNHIINAHAPQLADQIGEINADAAINAARMRIK